MTTIIEPTNQSEKIIAIVREEGQDMSAIAPTDTQCHADVDGERCQEEISFDMSTKGWSQMCANHTKQNLDARYNKNDAVKVKKFVETEEA